ncbi:hypothetical protein HJ590_06905 [Naumannella sp. ID2617S]|nr:hypothetical protein [Naumannella sp. ID2617S]
MLPLLGPAPNRGRVLSVGCFNSQLGGQLNPEVKVAGVDHNRTTQALEQAPPEEGLLREFSLITRA